MEKIKISYIIVVNLSCCCSDKMGVADVRFMLLEPTVEMSNEAEINFTKTKRSRTKMCETPQNS